MVATSQRNLSRVTASEVAYACVSQIRTSSPYSTRPCSISDFARRTSIRAGSHRVSIMALGLAKLCFTALIRPALVVTFWPAMLCAWALWSAVSSVSTEFCSI